jgi:hypothetical protein
MKDLLRNLLTEENCIYLGKSDTIDILKFSDSFLIQLKKNEFISNVGIQ